MAERYLLWPCGSQTTSSPTWSLPTHRGTHMSQDPHDLTRHGCPTCGSPATGTLTPARETDRGVQATGLTTIVPCGHPLLVPWVLAPPTGGERRLVD
jgi:hypothetical protein